MSYSSEFLRLKHNINFHNITGMEELGKITYKEVSTCFKELIMYKAWSLSTV